MTMTVGKERAKEDFLQDVTRQSGEEIRSCYQCGKCSAGCPMAADMDILPNQVMRYAQLNLRDSLLGSRSIWLCVSCSACSVRCPKGIDIARVMEVLRLMALESGNKPADHLVTRFNELFLSAVRKTGRINELPLAGMFNLLTFRPFKDISLLPQLRRTGKIGFETQKIHDINSIETIFAKAKRFADQPDLKREGGHE